MKYKYHKDFCLGYILDQADLMADCFVLSGEWGFDSILFAETVMTSKYGIRIMTDRAMIEYSDFHYMLEGFMREFNWEKNSGKTIYSNDVLWMAGYLYKYWVSTRDTNPLEVYRYAPIQVLEARYGFYHTQGFDYIIADLIDAEGFSNGSIAKNLMNSKEV